MPVGEASRLIVILFIISSLGAGGQVSDPVNRASRDFVESFYHWYVPGTYRRITSRPWEIALKQKRFAFSPQLSELLKKDSSVQAKCADSVGLNFDPFVNYQDPAEHYVVGRISRESQTYMAEVYPVWSGEQRERPDVRAEFVEKDGDWFFVNFHYPDGNDLLTYLQGQTPPMLHAAPLSPVP